MENAPRKLKIWKVPGNEIFEAQLTFDNLTIHLIGIQFLQRDVLKLWEIGEVFLWSGKVCLPDETIALMNLSICYMALGYEMLLRFSQGVVAG